MAIAKALQLEATRRRAVPLRFNFIARVQFELALPIRCRFRAFLVFTAYTSRQAVTLNFDPLTLTFDLEHLWCAGCAVLKLCNYVRNLSSIGQSTAELLQFEL